MAYVSEVFEELVAYSLILDAGCVVLVVIALHREVPVEVAGQLRATTCTSHKKASQVRELGEKFYRIVKIRHKISTGKCINNQLKSPIMTFHLSPIESMEIFV